MHFFSCMFILNVLTFFFKAGFPGCIQKILLIHFVIARRRSCQSQ